MIMAPFKITFAYVHTKQHKHIHTPDDDTTLDGTYHLNMLPEDDYTTLDGTDWYLLITIWTSFLHNL